MNKVFRDPIYGLITFDKKKDKLLLKLIDTPEFQRLRRIRQLGFSWFTYPTAVHTRFSHSLGTAYLAGLLFDKLNLEETSFFDEGLVTFEGQKQEHKLKKHHLKLLLQSAALLHDIGHGPFSHAFEEIMGKEHEDWTSEIIQSEDTEVYKIFVEEDKTIDEHLPLEVRKKFPRWINDLINSIFSLNFCNKIISSQLDVDRLDYLLRDAYMCGVCYGEFDLDWILKNISLEYISQDERTGIVVNGQKGIYSLESFILSRYHMYEQVYFHKTTRAAEKLMENIFERIKILLEENKAARIGPECKPIFDIFKGELSLSNYMKLDDFLIISYINRLSYSSEDPVLKYMCNNFINRNLYKRFDEGEDFRRIMNRTQEKYREKFFAERDLEEDYYYCEDDYTDVPYKDDYLFGETGSSSADRIWVKVRENKIRDLGEVSEVVKALRNKHKRIYRIYIDRKYYEEFESDFPK